MSKLCKMLQLIFGYDFGYFTYRSLKTKYIAKMFYLLRCVLVSMLLMYDTNPANIYSLMWYSCYVAKHLIFVLIFIFLRCDLTFYMFDCEMQDIDKALKCGNAARLLNKKKICTLFLWCLLRISRVLYFCIVSYSCSREILATVLFHIICAGFDTILIVMSFMYYSIYYRLFMFELKLKTDPDYDLNDLLILYRGLSDVAEKFKKGYDLTYLFIILLNVPDVMLGIFLSLNMFQKNTSEWVMCLLDSLLKLLAMSPTVAPALAAGKISSQTDNIRNLLHDRLLFENNELKCRQLKNLIAYIEARPLKFKVYKVIPLDESLLGIVCNFRVTYLIVLVQFTHLY